MTKSDAAIIDQIRAAFPSAEISSGAFSAWGGTYPDASEYERKLVGKTWDELDKDYLIRRSDALGFLGTRHLIGVLPVYLKALIELGWDSAVPGMLAVILTPPDVGSDDGLGTKRFNELVAELTEAQRIAVAVALTRYNENNSDLSAQSALDGYWKRYWPEQDEITIKENALETCKKEY